MSEKSRSLDILGVKPIAESINTLTAATVDGVAAFLSRICLPAAEEFGLLLRDRVREWRVANIAAIAGRAEQKLGEIEAPGNFHAHPRLVANILEEGSWIDDPVVQDLWGGLLSSSCTEDGDDDSNLVFVNLMADMTRLQARIVKYVSEAASKHVSPNGLILADSLTISLESLIDVTGENDIQRLDRELDHLREAGLLEGGFMTGTSSTDAVVGPTPLALHMYVRAQGSRKSPIDFFGLELPTSEVPKDVQVEDVS